MSTLPKTTQPVKVAAPRPAAPTARQSTIDKPEREVSFLFDQQNYMWMLGGLGLILLGFFLMAGGKSPDPHVFLWDEIYSFRRITLAPIVLLAGFVVEVYAIMKKPADTRIS